MTNFKVQEFMDSLSPENRERVKACRTTAQLQAFIESEGIDIMAFMNSEDRELSLDDLEGVEGGKGLIAGTLAAALAAITFASCGGTDNSFVSGAAHANVAKAVTTTVTTQTTVPETVPDVIVIEEPEADDEVEEAEVLEEEEVETDEIASENAEKEVAAKKTEKKKKSSKKTETAAKQTQPAAVKQQQTTQPAKQAQPSKVVIPRTYKSVYVENDMYVGTYVENNGGIGVIEVTNIGNSFYAVHINWVCGYNETNTWDFVGQFDGRATMNYAGCIKNNHVFGTNGTETISTIYSNGTGSIRFENNGLYWNDNMGDIIANTRFNVYKPKTAATEVKQETKQEKKHETKKQEEKKQEAKKAAVSVQTPKKDMLERKVDLRSDRYSAPKVDTKTNNNTNQNKKKETHKPKTVVETNETPAQTQKGGWAGSRYQENEAPRGGWAGSRYQENEDPRGGWAGSHYEDNEAPKPVQQDTPVVENVVPQPVVQAAPVVENNETPEPAPQDAPVVVQETPMPAEQEAPKPVEAVKPVVKPEKEAPAAEKKEQVNFSGSYYEINGVRITMEIHKSDRNDNSYEIVVKASESAEAQVVYHFYAHQEGDSLFYTNGYANCVVYSEEGVVSSEELESEGHNGKINLRNGGISWADSFGLNFIFAKN